MGPVGESEGHNEVSDPRADIPRERSFYPGQSVDSIRGNAPFTPVFNNGTAPRVPLLGIAIVAGAILLFEHFRKGR